MHIANFRLKHRVSQSGQAMIEYAILVILLVTLVVGGAELGIAAFHSNKVSEAAKSAANTITSALDSKFVAPNISEYEKQNRQESHRQGLLIDTDTDLASRNDPDGTLIAASSCDVIPGDACPAQADADEIRPVLGQYGICKTGLGEDINNNGLLDLGEDLNANGVLDFDYYDPARLDGVSLPQFSPDLPIDITSCDTTKPDFIIALRALLSGFGFDYSNSDPMNEFYEVCTSRMNTDGIEKIINCRPLLDNKEDDDGDGVLLNEDANNNGLLDDGEDLNANGILDREDINANATEDNVANGTDDSDPTFRRLLIRPKFELGNHDPSRTDFPFRNPSCTGSGTFDDGLPTDGKLYLFNPLPVDITNCTGGDNSVNALFNSLPAANQALMSMYTKVCVAVTSNNQISVLAINTSENEYMQLTDCAGNGGVIWMKPPGKICGAPGGSEVCPDPTDIDGDGNTYFNLNGATGFYFFGSENIAPDILGGGDVHAFIPSGYNQPETTFRPAFQIVCNSADYKSPMIDAEGACLNASSGFENVQINIRYRSFFESFITTRLDALQEAGLIQYFYNPSKIGQGSNDLTGIPGGELGPKGNNGLPSVKNHKDFRGCTNVALNIPDSLNSRVKTTISSCN